jgi:hypothetical protein
MRAQAVVPALRVDDATVIELEQKLARVIAQVDEIVDQQANARVDVGAVDSVSKSGHVSSSNKRFVGRKKA